MDTKFNLLGVSTAVIVRGIMTILAAINILCGYMGWYIVPLSEGDIGGVVDGIIVLVTAAIWLWGWWKNNSLTLNAQAADTVLEELNAADECLRVNNE